MQKKLSYEFNKILMVYLILLLFVMFNSNSFASSSTHNQTVIPKDWKSFFSAKPIVQNVVASNSMHKILIGIIDSGVDYNHPFLQNKIHYSLDKKNNIIGAGLDLIKNDNWPLPYLAETKFLYDTRRDQLDLHEARKIQLHYLLSLAPGLSSFIQDFRNYTQEADEGIEHGTHVAGLASYDDSRIGIVPYRIMPQTENAVTNENTGLRFKNFNEEFVNMVFQSIADANAKGVKVINLSLSLPFLRSDHDSDNLLLLFNRFEKIVKAYPDMVFVTASGNDNSHFDLKNRIHFPCGVESFNVICVSSLDADGELSDFTNIPLIKTPIIYAPGENILSTIPTYFCPSDKIGKIQNYLTGTSLFVDPNLIQKSLIENQKAKSDAHSLANEILNDCDSFLKTDLSKPNLESMSGTSMAAPIVARLIALKILSLPDGINKSGSEILTEFMKDSTFEQKGPLSIYKIRAPKPTWYNSEDDGFVTWSTHSREPKSDYFEFYLKGIQ